MPFGYINIMSCTFYFLLTQALFVVIIEYYNTNVVNLRQKCIIFISRRKELRITTLFIKNYNDFNFLLLLHAHHIII